MSLSSPGRLLVSTALLWSCSGGGETGVQDKAMVAPEPAPKVDVGAVDVPVVHPAWNKDAGDKSVPAELGGPGFTGEGWTTADEHQIGDPKAPQGGEFVRSLPDWPATTRMYGQNWNTYFTYFTAGGVVYQSLLELDPVTYDFAPCLATHWQISEDKSTYRFRINPEARWSDGEPVTAEDVVATWKLHMDPTGLDPSSVMTFGKFEEPKAVSKYIVEVKVKEENWRNFLYFASSLPILPAHEIAGLTGKEYVDKYQFGYTASTGPYIVKPEDIHTGERITLTRRKDWWGESNPAWDGLFNFDEITFVVVSDPQLAFEKTKKGELDYFWVQKAQWWAEDIPKLEDVKRGLLVPEKFYTEAPIGTQGLALNETVAPLDDVRVRKALQKLFDRKTLIKKLFYGEYEPLTSYFQGSTYANPGNQLVDYDEVGAVELLEQAGFTDKDPDGIRKKDGKRLHVTIVYPQQDNERWLTVFQESCKRAGIEVELQLLTPATLWKNLQARQYQIATVAWGGLTFPNPETSWRSTLADTTENNNVTAFRDAHADELMDQYDKEYDPAKRQQIIRDIDGILYDAAPYALGWYSASQRVLYWNKFGMPPWGVLRYGDRDDMFLTWWFDPQKEKELEAAKADPSKMLDHPPTENHFWQEWAKAKGLTSKGQGG